MKFKIGIVTTARSDFSSLLPVAKLLKMDAETELIMFVGGMHLARQFGGTVHDIENSGFIVDERFDFLLASDTPEALAKSVGLGMISFTEALARRRPDIIIIVGDRYELLAVTSAALVLGIPIAHISGGDITEGAFDNQVRYAVSMMSHLHFVALDEHQQRLIKMGEEAWRVTKSGDPAIDIIHSFEKQPQGELESTLGIELRHPVIIAGCHPTTRSRVGVSGEIDALLGALEGFNGTIIITSPNADPGYQVIIDRINDFISTRDNARMFSSLGQINYYNLLSYADVMVGNSSSGIWESPSFRLPVVNVGDRQRGRMQTRNVIDSEPSVDAIRTALNQALSKAFTDGLNDLVNPYGSGDSSRIVVSSIKKSLQRDDLLMKRYI